MGSKPIKKWKSGSIEGCIWSNKKKLESGEEVEFKTATLSRSFMKKGEDIWRNEVLNFKRSEIPKIQTVLHNLQQELFLNSDRDSPKTKRRKKR